MSLGLSILLVTYLILWTLEANTKYARPAKFLKICYFICLLTGFTIYLILQGLIISGAHTDDAEADVLIVLGAGVYNGVPSLILVSRLDAAYEYMQQKDDIPVIVTGGLGRGEIETDAEVMSRYLIMRGIDEHRIWKEEASTSTRENLAYSIDLMNEKGIDINEITVAVISNEFHLYRVRIIAKNTGLDAIGIAAETPGLHRKVLYYFREVLSLTLELLSRYLTTSPSANNMLT